MISLTQIKDLLDKIKGLEADLENAVEVAYCRGAYEWTRLNYPEQYERLLLKGNKIPSPDKGWKCVNAHQRCKTGGPCPYCETRLQHI